MQDVLVFGEQNSLDFSEIRASVIRIPEVSLRIEEAQNIWDDVCESCFSFQHFLSSDDSTFFNNINLKSLSLAVVQLGLMDRLVRLFHWPTYMVGNIQNDSALMVATGKLTFKELILGSPACHLVRPMAPLQMATETMLKGRMLPQYQAFVSGHDEKNPSALASIGLDGESYSPIGKIDMNLQNVLLQLVESQNVRRLIHIGPGLFDAAKGFDEYQMREVQIVESIDIDPMLGWFWDSLRRQDRIHDRAQ